MPDLNLTQVPLEIVTDEPNPAFDLTQTSLQVIANDLPIDFSLSQFTFQVSVPTEQWLSDSGAVLSCFEIFPAVINQPTIVVTQMVITLLAEDVSEDTFVCDGIEGAAYPPDYVNIVDVWEIDNVTKTFHCPIILPEALDEGGVKSGLLSAGEELPFAGQKRTVTLIYRTVGNPSFFTEVIGDDEFPANLGFTNSSISKRVHFNISELQNFYLVFWSWTGTISGSPPNLDTEFSGEIYIDCIQLDVRDWAGAGESLLVIYDD